jgi:parallel beta-helix repeat protein
MKRGDASLILVIVVLTSAVSLSVTIPEEASAYNPHNPIYIEGNGNFTLANGVTGGIGIPSNPYIIEGWEINASTDVGIRIVNTDANFIVRDSWIYDGVGFSGVHSGIWLENVKNGRIENVTVERCRDGIRLDSTYHNLIANNTVRHNLQYGMNLWLSSNNTVVFNNASYNRHGFDISQGDRNSVSYNNASYNMMEGFGFSYPMRNLITYNSAWHNWEEGIYVSRGTQNTITDNYVSMNNETGILISYSNGNVVANNVVSYSEMGIELGASTNVTVRNNSMVDNGIYIIAPSVENFNTHVIDASNTVNSKPVYYWKNATGGTVPLGAGQVILANCSNVIVREQNLSDGSVGMQIVFSSNNTLIRNKANSNRRAGIEIAYSHNNAISGNEVSINNWYGIQLWYSVGNVFANNTLSGNKRGIDHLYSSFSSIERNIVLSNTFSGINLFDSYYCIVSNNTVSTNSIYGIRLVFSEFNSIFYNNVSLTSGIGIDIWLADNNKIHHNDIIDNVQQASDFTDTNQWDDGYPSGGNYWSNYTGIDNCSGPNQSVCPDPDGIGDTPFIIDADSQDRYPLMLPLSLIHTRAPFSLRANLVGGGWEDVELKWSLSPDDGRGLNTVIGYNVYRNSTYAREGMDYQLLSFLPNGTSVFTDINAGEGDPSNYFYRLCAVDVGNNMTCATNQVAKFTHPLSEGQNLVSNPLVQSNESIERVLQTVRFDTAWTYDSSVSEWKWFAISKPYSGGLTAIDHRMGVWVNVTEASNFTVAGIVPLASTIQLKAGWNLAGFPSFDSTYTVGDLKSETGAIAVEGHDPSSPPYFLKNLGDGDLLQTGYSYWIRMATNVSWTVHNT